MVLAAEALAATANELTVKVNGLTVEGEYSTRTMARRRPRRPRRLRSEDGQVPARIVITTSGNPMTPEPAAERRATGSRGILRWTAARPISPAIGKTTGSVVVLKMTEPRRHMLACCSSIRLPAGLEIDNPERFDGGSITRCHGSRGDIAPTHAEYRDDRFVAAFERDGKDAATFAVAYMVRAVTPGHYVLPPATIEDMYRPERFGRTAFGALDVGGENTEG